MAKWTKIGMVICQEISTDQNGYSAGRPLRGLGDAEKEVEPDRRPVRSAPDRDAGIAHNGRLPVTFDDFQKYGIDRHAIAPAIREVEALGFVQITERGRAGNAEWRSPNLFRLTYMHTKDVSPTHEWRQIKTIKDAAMIAKAARKTSNEVNRASAVPASSTKKSEPPVGVKTNFNGEHPHRNYKTPNAGNPHYTNGGETPTTLDISGKGAAPEQRGGSIRLGSQVSRSRLSSSRPNSST
jgi:hypothetical protein